MLAPDLGLGQLTRLNALKRALDEVIDKEAECFAIIFSRDARLDANQQRGERIRIEGGNTMTTDECLDRDRPAARKGNPPGFFCCADGTVAFWPRGFEAYSTAIILEMLSG